MSETQQLAVLVIASLVIGIVGLVLVTTVPPLLEGNLVVDSYEAVLYENGTLTEKYTYDVKISGQYRMLYRLWEAPLTFTPPTQPSVEINSATPPTGTVAYAKDDTGIVIVYGDFPSTGSKSTISQLALTNEAGIFKPDYFNAGQYTAGYTYLLHPPIEYDSTTTHLNLKFAGANHIPYRTIKITVPAGSVQQVFVYPPSMSAVKSGDTYLITGSAAENENVAVEILAGPSGFDQVPGYRTEVADLAGKTSSGSFWYNAIYTLSYLLNYLAKAAVILVPLLFLIIYNRYGREKSFTVPEYLSTIPNPALKPWQVNLLFKGDALDFDEDGYYATLLDLHRRKIISILEKGEGKGIEIRVLSGATTDPYELRVLGFLALVSENGVLDTDVIAALTT
ncbi:MAG TPA: DUF2207 domain-containing protein, partial [Methanoregula sp.]|nr:DUF2207 domain-containing protein [Methanoregula sp.]